MFLLAFLCFALDFTAVASTDSAGLSPECRIDTLLYNGEHAINMVFAAEGYRSGELEGFRKLGRGLAEYFLSAPPFSDYTEDFNIFLANTVSDESGISSPEEERNTFFKVRAGNHGIGRLLVPEDIGKCEKALDGLLPGWDFICICVNSKEYGGGGGDLTVVTGHALAGEVLLHELGHSIGGLADEYWSAEEFIEEFPNMTLSPDNAPWSGIPGTGTYPLLRPDGSTAAYIPCRTTENSAYCKMGMLGKDFCPACSKAISAAIEEILVNRRRNVPDVL